MMLFATPLASENALQEEPRTLYSAAETEFVSHLSNERRRPASHLDCIPRHNHQPVLPLSLQNPAQGCPTERILPIPSDIAGKTLNMLSDVIRKPESLEDRLSA